MAKCFMCEKRLGTTFGTFDGQDFCLPCQGRVMGFVRRATEPLREALTTISEGSSAHVMKALARSALAR